MNEKENKKSIIKTLFKWIKKLDTALGNVRNIILTIITIMLIVIASNTDYIRGSVGVYGTVDVENSYRDSLDVNIRNNYDK